MFAAFILARPGTELLTEDQLGRANACSNSNDRMLTSAESDVGDHLGNDSPSVSPPSSRHQ